MQYKAKITIITGVPSKQKEFLAGEVVTDLTQEEIDRLLDMDAIEATGKPEKAPTKTATKPAKSAEKDDTDQASETADDKGRGKR